MTFRPSLILGLFLFACAACAPSGAERNAPPQYTITTQREADSVTPSAGTDSVRFDITSPFGISSATIEAGVGTFPEQVAFRLYLDGLEEFTVTRSDGSMLQLGVASSPPHAVWQSAISRAGESQPLTPDDPEWATVAPVDGGYDVALSPAFSAEIGPTLTVRWVDFFR